MHFCCVATVFTHAIYSLVSLIANYIFLKALGEKNGLVAKYTAVQPAVVRICLVKSAAPSFSVRKCTNDYGNGNDLALTVGQTAVSQSNPETYETFAVINHGNKLKLSRSYLSGIHHLIVVERFACPNEPGS